MTVPASAATAVAHASPAAPAPHWALLIGAVLVVLVAVAGGVLLVEALLARIG